MKEGHKGSETNSERVGHLDIRALEIIPDYIMHPPGSVLISTGNTKVICTASVEDRVPRFVYGSGKGWLSAEYSMLPGSTGDRTRRENATFVSGRSKEIQRLIGRSLRSCIDLSKTGEKTFWIDCDVIQADGGSRTASVNGGFVALALAVRKLMKEGYLRGNPLKWHIGAVSVGLVRDEVVLDLDYENDFRADVDMNVVMNENGDFIEVQGTAEGKPFTSEQLGKMMEAAARGIGMIIEKQKAIVDVGSLG